MENRFQKEVCTLSLLSRIAGRLFLRLCLRGDLDMCYAAVCFVSNTAAGMRQRLSAREEIEMEKERMPFIQEVLRETVKHLSEDRRCPCARALEGARFPG